MKKNKHEIKKTYGVITPKNRLQYILEICKINSTYDWDNNMENNPQDEFKEIVKIIKGSYDN